MGGVLHTSNNPLENAIILKEFMCDSSNKHGVSRGKNY